MTDLAALLERRTQERDLANDIIQLIAADNRQLRAERDERKRHDGRL